MSSWLRMHVPLRPRCQLHASPAGGPSAGGSAADVWRAAATQRLAAGPGRLQQEGASAIHSTPCRSTALWSKRARRSHTCLGLHGLPVGCGFASRIVALRWHQMPRSAPGRACYWLPSHAALAGREGGGQHQPSDIPGIRKTTKWRSRQAREVVAATTSLAATWPGLTSQEVKSLIAHQHSLTVPVSIACMLLLCAVAR